jgi:hypothetical protein
MEINKTQTINSWQYQSFVDVLIDSWQQKCQMEINKTEANNFRQCRSFVNVSIDLWQHTCRMEIKKNEKNSSWQCQFFVEKMIVDYSVAPASFYDNFQLVVKSILIPSYEVAQRAASKLIVICAFGLNELIELILASGHQPTSKISFIFGEECRTFCEGEWGQQLGNISLIGYTGLIGLIKLVELISFVGHNGIFGLIGLNGLAGQISLIGLIGINGRIGLNGNNDIVGLVSIIGKNGLINHNDLVGFISLGVSSISLNGHNGDISLIGLGFISYACRLVSFIGLGGHNGDISLIGLGFVLSVRWLISFIGLSLLSFMDLGLAGLINDISLISPSCHNGLVGFMGLSLVGLIGLGRISLIGQISLVGQISLIIGHNCLNGIIGLGLVSLVNLVGLSGINDLVSLDSLVAAIIAAAEFLVVMATQAAAAKTHGVAIKLASSTKTTNAAIWYYCAALLLVLLSLIWRESGLWCECRVFPSLAGLDLVFENALQNAKQLFYISLPQMTKYCIMRECENILCGYLYVYDGDLVFVILKGIYGFKFPKRFLEISSRDLTSSFLFCQS